MSSFRRLYAFEAKFDLTVEIFEMDGLCCTWEYSTDLFDHSRIVRMVGHFETLLNGICADPDRRVSELPLLGPDEGNTVLVDWNDTGAAFPDGVCIHHAFEARRSSLF